MKRHRMRLRAAAISGEVVTALPLLCACSVQRAIDGPVERIPSAVKNPPPIDTESAPKPPVVSPAPSVPPTLGGTIGQQSDPAASFPEGSAEGSTDFAISFEDGTTWQRMREVVLALGLNFRGTTGDTLAYATTVSEISVTTLRQRASTYRDVVEVIAIPKGKQVRPH